MVVLLRYYSYKEKTAIIEKGLDPGMYVDRRRRGDLRFPFLAIGVAIGLLLGNVLEEYSRLDNEVAYFSMALLFGGLGLIMAYFYHKKEEEKGQ